MAKYTCFILFFLCVSTVKANDSLQTLYRHHNQIVKIKDTTALVESYKNIGDYLYELGDLTKSNSYLNKGLQLASKANITREVGILSNLLAANASYEGNRELSLRYYRKALKAFADVKDLNKVAMTLMNMGSEYEFMGNYKYAVAYMLKAINNKELSGVETDLAYYYQHLGQLFKETDRSKWKFYVEKAYQISKRLSDERVSTKASIFNDFGGIAQREQNYKLAYSWFDSLIVFSKANDYQTGLLTAYSNRSQVYRAEKRYDNALADVLNAMAIGYKLERNYSIIIEHTNAADLLVEMGKVSEAKVHAEKALKLATSLKCYPEEEAAAYRTLSLIGERTNNWELAFKNYKAFKIGMDSIGAVDVKKTLYDLELKYQTSEKEKEIERLDNENRLNNLKLQRAQISIAAIVFIVLLLSLLAVVLYRRKRLKLQKQQAELKQKLLRSQMNPHFMFNTLNAINQYIQTNKGHEASDYLAQYSRLMRQILENSAVEFVSLDAEIEFLRNYLDMQQLRFDKSFAYGVSFDDSIDPEQFEIPPMIAQPFIENAVEHGVRGMQGGEIKIHFSFTNNTLTLTVADNGKGFQTSTQNIHHKSFALDITRERLNITGNNTEKLKITSPDPQTGKGTLVSIDVPFRKFE